MFWHSILAMTVIDVAIMAVVCCALVYFFRNRHLIHAAGTRFGLGLIGFGLLVAALFFASDLAIMHVAPMFIPMADAMEMMKVLHLEYIWPVALVCIGSISIGMLSLVKGLLQVIVKLQDGEGLLKGVLNATPASITLRDSTKRFLFVNDTYAALVERMGYDPSKLVGRRLSEVLTDADSNQTVERLVDDVMASGEAIRNREYRPELLPDKTFLLSIHPVFGQDGKISSIVTSNLDITEHKRADDALRRREQAYRDLVELSPDAVIVQCNGKIEYANRSACELFGAKTDAELVGRESLPLSHPDYQSAILGNREQVELEQRSLRISDWRHQRLDGTFFDSEITIGPMQWNGQRGTINLIRDVTTRREAERQQAESDARLRAVVDNSPAAILLKDTQGRYQLVSKIFLDWINVSDDSWVGKTVFDFEPRETAERITAHENQVIESGRPLTQERVTTFPDGVTRTIWSHKFPLFGADGACIAVGTVNIDMTEQRDIQAQLIQAQKMEAVGQLTGGIAHDFNNLLGIVIGNLDFLTEELQNDENLLDLVQAATAAALSGADLNRQLLAFSRQQPLSPQTIDLNGHVSRMRDMMQRTLGETITVDAAISPDLWRTDADPAQVESALVNLALNARDAMPEGGRLTISTANIGAGDGALKGVDLAPGDYVMLALSDTGKGMPPEVRERAFDPFFTTKKVGEGSGLGLSMVFGFAKQSGGHVTLESEVGRGTTVRLYLPKTTRATSDAGNALEAMPAD